MAAEPLYVSYFTPAYAEEAAGLVASLDALGLPHHVRAMPSRGAWGKNCAAKPAYLCALRGRLPDRPLVWLDADSRVAQRPSLFYGPEIGGVDFAAHWLGGEDGGGELISACLYFAPTQAANALLIRWGTECACEPDVWDQKHLQRVAERESPGLRVLRLPPEMNWIEAEPGVPDISERVYGKREPVIIQRQASRRLRRTAG